MKALKWMFMKNAALVIRPMPALADSRRLLAMLRNCTPERFMENKGRMVRVAEYSRDCLLAVRADT